MALVGGATILATPLTFTYFSRLRALARDGRCKAFADCADGIGLGEGAGTIVLESLSAAWRRGHRILAVVKGSAVNQDGDSVFLTTPNGRAQQQVIEAALADAGLTAPDVDAVEAHGAGTVLGDPIEARALTEVYGKGRALDRPLWVGSVKSNIGHSQAAAGLAGVIKMTMALRNGWLPRSLHIDRPTRAVAWNGTVSPLTEAIRWPDTGHARRVGISSFGISGTNAHVILEEAPVRPPRLGGSRSAGPRVRSAGSHIRSAGSRRRIAVPIALSAKTPAALSDQARNLHAQLAERPDVGIADVGHALVTTRSLFKERAVIIASDRSELLTRLRVLSEGQDGPGIVRGRARDRGKTVFIFPGQGSQWVGMASRLLRESSVFAKHMRTCAEALSRYVEWPLMTVLREQRDLTALSRVEVVQPVLFSVMTSLAALWRSTGVRADAVVGHSQGEIAAAYVAGALSLDDALRIVTLRSKAVASLQGQGVMAAVPLSAPILRDRIAESGCMLTISAVNGPASCVVSGDSGVIEEFCTRLNGEGIRAQLIPVTYASHCAHVEAVRDQILSGMAGIEPCGSSIPFYSSVTGALIETSQLNPSYWYSNLRRTVQFEAAARALIDDGFGAFIEVSPHPILTSCLWETVDALGLDRERVTVVGSLARGRGGFDQFIAEVARVHVAGPKISWDGCFSGRAADRADLPTYPFQRRPYWLTGHVVSDNFGSNSPDGPDERAEPAPNASGEQHPRAGLFRLDWQAISARCDSRVSAIHVVGSVTGKIGDALRKTGIATDHWPDMDSLVVSGANLVTHGEVTMLSCTGSGPEAVISATHSTAQHVLAEIRCWLDSATDGRLVVLTQGAVAVDDSEDVPNLAGASIWGMIRAAQSENPNRFVLIDIDHRDSSWHAIAVGLSAGEPQLAIRDGIIRVPRLVNALAHAVSGPRDALEPGRRGVPESRGYSASPWFDPEGTILITGGTGAVGGHLARHLVREHGAKHLLLMSLRGPDAPGSASLVDELDGLGADVTVAACDVSDLDALSRVLAPTLGRRGLTAVIHTAGVVYDSTLTAMTDEMLSAVLRAKVDGAWNLHTLTQGRDVDAFVVFSSLVGILGNIGQVNYAAANAFLNGLASYRRKRGLPCTTLAWGTWPPGMGGMSGRLDKSALARFARLTGSLAMRLNDALALFDRTLSDREFCSESAVIIPARLDKAAVLDNARRRTIFAQPDSAEHNSNRQSSGVFPGALAGLPDVERQRVITDIVRTHVATVLGHTMPSSIDIECEFKDLGFDSASSLELCNRLNTATGLRLPKSLIFDYPTPADLAAMLCSTTAAVA